MSFIATCELFILRFLSHVSKHILGWLQTVEGYFNTYTRSTLDQIVDRLTANPSYKFVWTEIIFLEMWWTQTTEERKQLFKKYIISTFLLSYASFVVIELVIVILNILTYW